MGRMYFILVVALFGCPKNDVINPPIGEGTDYPCGYRARLCQVSNICCVDEADCPGTYSCPAQTDDGPHCCSHVQTPAPPIDLVPRPPR